MVTILPSNEECHRLYLDVGQHGSREFFERLRVDAEAHDLLEADFSENLRPQFHELFWEVYLAGALRRAGLELKRGKRNLSEPDYRFPFGAATVFVEAVACGDPSAPANCVPPPTLDENSDFEDGFAPGGHVIQRLAQSIDYKIAALSRPQAIAAMAGHGQYVVVIALNGCRALNGHPHNDIGVPFLPFVTQALFGATECRIDQNGRTFWVCTKRMNTTQNDGDSFPMGHFSEPTWTTKDRKTDAEMSVSTAHIAGVLYSQVSPDYTTLPLGDDFVFIQNPHGPDVTRLFKFCKGGRWAREGNILRRF